MQIILNQPIVHTAHKLTTGKVFPEMWSVGLGIYEEHESL